LHLKNYEISVRFAWIDGKFAQFFNFKRCLAGIKNLRRLKKAQNNIEKKIQFSKT